MFCWVCYYAAHWLLLLQSTVEIAGVGYQRPVVEVINVENCISSSRCAGYVVGGTGFRTFTPSLR